MDWEAEKGIDGKSYGDIDSWIGDDDDNNCYACEGWTDDDGHGNCNECGVSFTSIDPYVSASTAVTHSTLAPKVDSTTGDMWNRSSSYTWGGGQSWWQRGVSGITDRMSPMTSMWGGSWSSSATTDTGRLLKHKRHLDSLCKVVDPTVSHTLDFAYEEGRNYSNITNGRIVIDGTILKDNDDMLDIAAGLSIHEKLHLIHTTPIKDWEREYAHDHKLNMHEQKLLHNIVNIIEDEYIEKQLSKNCAGFVSYIDAVKEHFFDKNKDKISDAHKDEFLDVINTLLAFVRYPKVIDKDRRKRHGPHIRFFAKALQHGLDDRESTYKAFDSIFQYMKALCEELAPDDDTEGKLEKAMKDIEERLGDMLSKEEMEGIREQMERDLKSDWDKKGSPVKVSFDSDTGHMDTIQTLSDYGISKDMLDKEIAKSIKELEDSDYHETKMGKDKVLYPKQTKITWRNAMPDERERDVYKEEVKQMRSVITSLKRKINLYGNTQKYTIRNQKRGKLDKRVLHRIPMGARELFKMDYTNEDKPLDVTILVDESGSMSSGYRMRYARQSAIAIKEALVDNPKLNLWVYGHTADGADGWHNDSGSTNLTQYWGPTMKDRPMAMGAMSPKFENRDGNAIWAVADKVTKESDQPLSNKLMIVLSDGQPAAERYGGSGALNHVRGIVRELEGKGWSIIQIGFGGASEWTMAKMFNNYIEVRDATTLPQKLSRIMRKVLKI